MIGLLAGGIALAPAEGADGDAGRVSTVTALCGSLSRQIGKPVRIARDLGRLPVFCQPNGRGGREVLGDLAQALVASVVPRDGGFAIERTANDRKRVVNLSRDLARDTIAEAFRKVDHDVAAAKSLGSDLNQYATYVKLVAKSIRAVRTEQPGATLVNVPPSEFSPAGRLLRKLLDRIGMDALTEVDEGRWRVFSNRANPNETPIPGCEADIARFVEDERRFVAAGIGRDDDAYQAAAAIKASGEVPEVKDLKVMVIERRLPTEIIFTCRAFDRNGELVDVASLFSRHAVWVPSPIPKIQSRLAAPTARWVDLSPTSRTYYSRLFGSWEHMMDPSQVETDQATWPDSVRHPARFEPDSFLIRELMNGWARENPSRAVVAILPDSIWDAAMFAVKGGRGCLDLFEELALSDGRCTTTSNRHALLIRPANPLAAETAFADREILEESVGRILDAGRIRLADWSHLMEVNPAQRSNRLVASYATSLFQSSLPIFTRPGQVPDAIYRLMGALFDDGAIGVDGRGEVALTPSRYGAMLWDWVGEPNFALDHEDLPPLKRQPTEIFPTEEPAATVRWSISSEPALLPAQAGKGIYPRALTYGQLANLFFANPLYKMRREVFDQDVKRIFGKDGFGMIVAQKRNLRIEFRLGATPISYAYTFADDEYLHSEPLTYSEVSPEIWENLYKAILKIKVSGPALGPARGTPPPP